MARIEIDGGLGIALRREAAVQGIGNPLQPLGAENARRAAAEMQAAELRAGRQILRDEVDLAGQQVGEMLQRRAGLGHLGMAEATTAHLPAVGPMDIKGEAGTLGQGAETTGRESWRERGWQ